MADGVFFWSKLLTIRNIQYEYYGVSQRLFWFNHYRQSTITSFSGYKKKKKNRFQNFSLFLKKHYISIVLLSFLLLSFSFSSSLFPLSFDMLISIISLVVREINDEVWQSLFFQNFQISYTSPIKTNYIVMDIIIYNK